jgi:trigger factor
MKITNDKIENSQMFLTIEMEPAEVEESMQTAYKRLVKKTRIPGFRKGKAPRGIFEHYVGKESLLEDALDDILPKAYEKAVEEQKIEAIARPQFEIEKMEPLVLKATVPLKPTIELGDYKSLKVEQETVEVTDEKIDAVVDQLRHQYATWEPVEGRPVDFNDLVIMDILGTIGEKKVIDQKAAQYQVIKGQTYPVIGFSEQLTGMNPGDEREFEMEYPADYGDEELAGKKVKFKIKAIEIKKENLPEITDEFAKTVGAEFETMAALRERASADMKARMEQQARVNFEEEIIHSLADISKVEYPPVLVESEINRVLNQQFQNNSKSFENYLASVKKTEAEIREELKPSAEHRVVHSLVLGKVAEVEEIKASDEEIDAEIEKAVKDSKEDKKDELKKLYNNPEIRDSISLSLRTRKTVEKLTEYCAVPKGTTDETKKTKTTRAKKKKKEETK